MSDPESMTVTALDACTITVRRAFAATPERVFDAWIDPAVIPRWMVAPGGWTMPVCDVDAREGGTYRFVWSKADGPEIGMGGTYREIRRPDRLVTTELFDEDWTGGETVVTLDLSEIDGRTIATQTILYGSPEARDRVLASGMIEGMAGCFGHLDAILAGG